MNNSNKIDKDDDWVIIDDSGEEIPEMVAIIVEKNKDKFEEEEENENTEEEKEYQEWLRTHPNSKDYSNRCFTPDRMDDYWDKQSDEYQDENENEY
jgi:hypothetical protein